MRYLVVSPARRRLVALLLVALAIVVGFGLFAAPVDAQTTPPAPVDAQTTPPAPVVNNQNSGGFIQSMVSFVLDDLVFSSLFGLILYVLEAFEPNVGEQFFQDKYSVTLKLAIFLTVPFLLVATMSALAKGGLRAVLHTYLVLLPVSVLGGAAALAVVSLAQAIDQNFTDAFMGSTRSSMAKYAESMNQVNGGSAADMGVAMAITALLTAVAALFLAGEMIFRSILIYLSVLFLPMAFAASVWQPTRKWLTSLIELTLVSIFSKFIAVAVLSTGFSAIAEGIGAGNTSPQQRLGYYILGGVTISLACLVLPALMAFVMGPGSRIIGREEGFNEMGATPERQASRTYALQTAQSVGSLLTGK